MKETSFDDSTVDHLQNSSKHTQNLQPTFINQGATICEGDLVLLWFPEDTTYLVEVIRGRRVNIHCGKPLIRACIKKS